MPRGSRHTPGGYVYHVLNRSVARLTLFQKDADYGAFERVLQEAHQLFPIRILAYCVMPNHWHFVLWPEKNGDLTAFVRWLTHTHVMRWHAHHETSGTGHLYQGRFKAFPVEAEEYFYSVVRYVERNALRAGLTDRAESWRWSSLWRREYGDAESRLLLARWPLPCPRNWSKQVNLPQNEQELNAVRAALRRGQPLGDEDWRLKVAKRLGIESTLRPRDRPRKTPETQAMS